MDEKIAFTRHLYFAFPNLSLPDASHSTVKLSLTEEIFVTRIYPFTVAALVALLSTSALADINSIKSQDDDTTVTVNGVVKEVEDTREFTLQDASGQIEVEIESTQSVVLKPGDKVTVEGKTDTDWFTTEIEAHTVTVHKDVSSAITDAIEGSTTLSFEGATTYHIANLPNKGLVKIAGTVIDVDNEKEFTLQDNTGKINVDVESAEAAALTEGASVTVIGLMDNDLTGKDVNATKVIVTNTAPVASYE